MLALYTYFLEVVKLIPHDNQTLSTGTSLLWSDNGVPFPWITRVY